MDPAKAVVLALVAFTVADTSSPGPAPLLQLRDGHQMPQLALGTWLGFSSASGLKEGQEQKAQAAVETAIRAGYRHIDTAAIYDTERAVGAAINAAIAAGEVRREDLFVTTKLWNDKHAEKAVVPALCESLEKLGLDYVDLYLIHWPFGQFANLTFDTTKFEETWRGMVAAQQLGLARSIGVSNFNAQQLDRLAASSEVKPAVLQIELNLSLQQEELRAYCKANQIAVMAYTPFGSLFGAKLASPPPPPRLDDPLLVQMASKYNKTVPQVALRYLLELGVVPIPKSVTPARVQQNIDIFDFALTGAERRALQGFDVGRRSLDVSFWASAPDYPFEKTTGPQEEQ